MASEDSTNGSQYSFWQPVFLLDGGQGDELQGAELLPTHLAVVLGHLVNVFRAAGRGVEGRGDLDRAALLEGLA
jgi:hypothetical protein